MIHLFISPRNPRHRKLIFAFKEGLDNLGWDNQIVPLEQGYQKCDWAVQHSWSKQPGHTSGDLRNAIIKSHNNPSTHVIIEQGFTDRSKYYAIGIGGINGRAYFGPEDVPSDRWEKTGLVLEDPVGFEPKKVLICGQVLKDAALGNLDYERWLNELYVEMLRFPNDYKIEFRPHPSDHGKVKIAGLKRQENNRTLWEDLRNYRLTISYNSNSGTESLIRGVPSLYFDKGSMLSNFQSAAHIEEIHEWMVVPPNINLENRQKWANRLAYSQWTLEEIKEGLPQQHLMSKVFT